MSSAAIGGLIFLWALFLLYIPFTLLYLRNSDIHPIKGRAPRVVVALNVCLFIFGCNTLANVVFLDDYPCTLTIWITFLFGTLGCEGIYIYRLLRLLFSYEITKNIMAQTKVKSQWKQNWFTRNRGLVGPYVINRFTIFLVLFFVIVLIVLTGASPELNGTQACPGRVLAIDLSLPVKIWFVVYGVVTAMGLLAMTVLGVKLRQYHSDAFAIKNEFTIVMWTSYPAFYVWLCLSLTPEPSWVTTGYLVSFALHSIFLVGTVWPFILSVREKRAIKAQDKAKLKEGLQLIEVLQLEEGFQAFSTYLQHEFSSENLFFWGEVKDFQCLPVLEDVAIKEHAQYIYDRYVAEDSPNQVNISYLQQREIRSAMDKLAVGQVDENTTKIFDGAQNEVYALMATDTFQRFLRRPESQQVKKLVLGIRRSKAADPSGQKTLCQTLADGDIEIAEVKQSPLADQISITVNTVPTHGLQRTLTRSTGEREGNTLPRSITLSPTGSVSLGRPGRGVSQSPSFYRNLSGLQEEMSGSGGGGVSSIGGVTTTRGPSSPSLTSITPFTQGSSPPSPSLFAALRGEEMPALSLAINMDSSITQRSTTKAEISPHDPSCSTPSHDTTASSEPSSSRRTTDDAPLVGGTDRL